MRVPAVLSVRCRAACDVAPAKKPLSSCGIASRPAVLGKVPACVHKCACRARRSASLLGAARLLMSRRPNCLHVEVQVNELFARTNRGSGCQHSQTSAKSGNSETQRDSRGNAGDAAAATPQRR
jgi:hypothetical protein